MRSTDIDFYTRLAKGIACQFGSDCEVAVYDLQSKEEDSAIIAIENGHVSGRGLGDGPLPSVRNVLFGEGALLDDQLCFLSKTEDGKVLKSTIVFIRNDSSEPVGAISINCDITLMLAWEEHLHDFNSSGENASDVSGFAPRNVTDLLDSLIEQSVHVVGKPAALMSRDDKVRAIGFLNDSGAFLVTKSGQKVCKYFGISKYTLYSYIDEAGKAKS